jgi:hypothetical protein
MYQMFNDNDLNFQNILNNSFRESVNNEQSSTVDINLMMSNISNIDKLFN